LRRSDVIDFSPSTGRRSFAISPAETTAIDCRRKTFSKAGVRSGHHFAPAMLPSGCNVYETLGSGYTPLAFGTKAKVLKDFRDVAAELRMPLTIVQDDCKGAVERYQANLILIRPDQFVCWA
jgi:hypothetical protein